jgi:hypothetical protein
VYVGFGTFLSGYDWVNRETLHLHGNEDQVYFNLGRYTGNIPENDLKLAKYLQKETGLEVKYEENVPPPEDFHPIGWDPYARP